MSPRCIRGVLHAGFETSSVATPGALGSSFFSLAIELELAASPKPTASPASAAGRSRRPRRRSSAERGPSGRRHRAAAPGRGASRSSVGIGPRSPQRGLGDVLDQGGARASRRRRHAAGAAAATERADAGAGAGAVAPAPAPTPVLVLVAGPMARRPPSWPASPRGGGRLRRRRGTTGTAASRRRCRPRPRIGAAAPFLPLAPRAAAPRRLEVNHAPPARPRRRSAASRACCSRPRRAPPGRAPASVVIYLLNPRGDSGWPRPRRSPRQHGRSADRRRGRGPAVAACAPPRRRGAVFFDSRWSRRRPPRRPRPRGEFACAALDPGRSSPPRVDPWPKNSPRARRALRGRSAPPRRSDSRGTSGRRLRARLATLGPKDSCSFDWGRRIHALSRLTGCSGKALWQRGAMCAPL